MSDFNHAPLAESTHNDGDHNSTRHKPRPRRRSRLWALGFIVLLVLTVIMAPKLWRSKLAAQAPKAATRPASEVSSNSKPSILRASIAPRVFAPPGGGGAPAPYSDESAADEFAIAVVQPVQERGGVKHLVLNLNEVFVGRLPSGRFLAKDKMVVRMECSLPPRNLGLRTERYKPGATVAVYLRLDEKQSPKRWVVHSLAPINAARKEYWRERLQKFADIILAGEAKQSEGRFRELLSMGPKGRIDYYYPLAINPHPAARPAIRELWRQRVKQYPLDPPQDDSQGTKALLYLMRNLNEAEMLDEVLQHALQQKPGQRAFYFSQLRFLAEYSDSPSRQKLIAGLKQFLADSPDLDSIDENNSGKIKADVSFAQMALKQVEQFQSRQKAGK